MNADYENAEGTYKAAYRERDRGREPLNCHTHDTYEIYYLADGERLYFIQGHTYYTRRNDLILINPGIPHRTMNMQTAGSGAHKRLLITFSGDMGIRDDLLQPLLSRVFTPERHVLRLTGESAAALETLTRRILSEMIRSTEWVAAAMLSLFLELLVFVAYHSGENAYDEAEGAHPDNRRIFHIVRYINQHYRESLSLEQLSRTFYISKYYLCKQFKARTGMTVNEYLNTIRVRESENMLFQTKWPVSRIAGEVGFNSISNYNRVFRAVVRTSPLAYRKMRMRP